MRIRDYVGVSERRQKQITRTMEVSLVGIFAIGIYVGQIGIVVNAAIGILVTNLVPALERDYDIPMDPALVLWITAADFLHALGTIPLPPRIAGVVGTVPAEATSISLYQVQGWWDHLTHAVSSSLVAGAGYATVRALDEHDPDIDIPPKLLFVFILMFVVAFGVFWEVIEFVLEVFADVAGLSILTQYGLDDTMYDLLFDVLGGLLVAIWGTAYLTDVAGAIRDRLNRRTQTG